MKFITKLFKKQKPIEEFEEEKIIIPDLMESLDMNKKINLMATDPINLDFEPVKVEKKPEIIESPGIENQLMDDLNPEKIDNLKIKETSIISNAFNMTPHSEDESSMETLETETVNLQTTQKLCSECGTPNDILNKFCVSCGNNFDSTF